MNDTRTQSEFLQSGLGFRVRHTIGHFSRNEVLMKSNPENSSPSRAELGHPAGQLPYRLSLGGSLP